MAVTAVTTSTFASAYSAAAAGDTLVLAAGTYPWSTGTFNFGKRLIIQAADWAVGKNVTGTAGHNGSGCAVKVTGRQSYSSGAKGTIMRGIWFEASNAQSGAGSWFDQGGIGWEDCVLQNRTAAGVGCIGIVLGGASYSHSDGSAYAKRCRFHKIGDSELDHAIYFKGIASGGWLDEDCLFYDITGYSHHLYGNCDGGISRRFVSDRCGKVRAGGVVFSGDINSSTGFTGCFYTRNWVIEDAQITNTQTAPPFAAIESYWGCTVGTGNVVRDTNVNQASGIGSRIKGGGSTLSGVTLTGLLNVVPGYADPTNGDFRIEADSPALGYGPTYIQPDDGPAPPPAVNPNPVTGLTATVGVTSQRVTLTWTNPGGTWDTIIVRRATGAYPTTPTSGTSVYSSTGTTVNDNGLANGTTYFYSVFVKNGTLYSAPTQVTGTPAAPVVVDEDIVGKTTVGTAGWKGMTPDVKRGWLYSFPPDKQIVSFKGYIRGTATGPGGNQYIRAVAYNATAGVNASMPLLGVSTGGVTGALVLDQDAEECTFTVSPPIVLPAAGGQFVIGLQTGPKIGTFSPSTAELQYAYDVQAGALHVNAGDAYLDGASSTWGTLTLDTAHGTFWAVLEDVSVPTDPPPAPVSAATATAGPGGGVITVTWTAPTTPFDNIQVRRKTGGYPSSSSDGTLAYSGTASSLVDTGLSNGTAYFYGIYVERDGLYSTAVQRTATPIADAPPPDDEEPPPPPPPPSQGLLAAIDQSILYLEDYLTTATAALTSSGLTVTRDDDDLAVSNYTLATDCLAEVRRARALLFRMTG